jgi:very-short-patch-repair endonuclease
MSRPIKYNITKEILYQKYITDKLLVHQIAMEFGCNRSVIFRRLKQFNIPTMGNSFSHTLIKGVNHPRYTGGRKVSNCIDCNKKLKNSYAIRCHSCNMINRWKDLEYKQKTMTKTISKSKPFNNKEQILNTIICNDFKFVGDGKFWIEQFNPDFIDLKNKKIIELYGDYWHNLPNYKIRDKYRLKVYERNSYKTLIIWEHELKDLNKLNTKILIFNK